MISQYFWPELPEWMIFLLTKVGKTWKGNRLGGVRDQEFHFEHMK